MLTHGQIWFAVDALASRFELSPSGLAKKAGLDPTSFNKSKRKTSDGRERWPSTESLAKILAATETTLQDFVNLVEYSGRSGFAEDTAAPDFQVNMPEALAKDDQTRAIQLNEDHYAPFYNKGTTILVSSESKLKPGQKALFTLANGSIRIGIIYKTSAKKIEAEILYKKKHKRILLKQDIASVVRIVWVSQ